MSPLETPEKFTKDESDMMNVVVGLIGAYANGEAPENARIGLTRAMFKDIDVPVLCAFEIDDEDSMEAIPLAILVTPDVFMHLGNEDLPEDDG